MVPVLLVLSSGGDSVINQIVTQIECMTKNNMCIVIHVWWSGWQG